MERCGGHVNQPALEAAVEPLPALGRSLCEKPLHRPEGLARPAETRGVGVIGESLAEGNGLLDVARVERPAGAGKIDVPEVGVGVV